MKNPTQKPFVEVNTTKGRLLIPLRRIESIAENPEGGTMIHLKDEGNLHTLTEFETLREDLAIPREI